jgi:ubiquinone/menaquinone biosynthesis C-methylase UbiE
MQSRSISARPYSPIRLILPLYLSAILPPLATVHDLHGESPATSGRYMGREIATTMHYSGAEWLTRDSRQREEDCKRLLAELHVKPGQAICDMGCGNGFYTLKLARLAGAKGKVYAVDIQQEMLDMLTRRVKSAKLTNIVPLLSTETDPRLKENSIDLMLMVDVYHEFSQPEAMLKAIRKSLKPDGRIALAEFRAEDANVPIKPEHKMSKKQILKEFTANGLKLSGQFDKLPWQHLMFFARDDAPEPAKKAPEPPTKD